MKKVVGLSIMLLITIAIMGNVYAAITCNANLQTSKTEFSKDEEFVVEVNLSNIQGDKGIIALGATLEYDKESLTLLGMEGTNGWSKPSYNASKGKLVMDRDGFATGNETIFKMTFKVKEEGKKNPVITLKDISVSNGNGVSKIGTTYKNITIKEEIQNVVPQPGENTGTQKPSTNTSGQTSGNNTSTQKPGTSLNPGTDTSRPETGNSDLETNNTNQTSGSQNSTSTTNSLDFVPDTNTNQTTNESTEDYSDIVNGNNDTQQKTDHGKIILIFFAIMVILIIIILFIREKNTKKRKH